MPKADIPCVLVGFAPGFMSQSPSSKRCLERLERKGWCQPLSSRGIHCFEMKSLPFSLSTETSRLGQRSNTWLRRWDLCTETSRLGQRSHLLSQVFSVWAALVMHELLGAGGCGWAVQVLLATADLFFLEDGFYNRSPPSSTSTTSCFLVQLWPPVPGSCYLPLPSK